MRLMKAKMTDAVTYFSLAMFSKIATVKKTHEPLLQNGVRVGVLPRGKCF